MRRTFLFMIPGDLDLAVHADCYLDAIRLLRDAGYPAYLLKAWSND